jgi:hypothetical protein
MDDENGWRQNGDPVEFEVRAKLTAEQFKRAAKRLCGLTKSEPVLSSDVVVLFEESKGVRVILNGQGTGGRAERKTSLAWATKVPITAAHTQVKCSLASEEPLGSDHPAVGVALDWSTHANTNLTPTPSPPLENVRNSLVVSTVALQRQVELSRPHLQWCTVRTRPEAVMTNMPFSSEDPPCHVPFGCAIFKQPSLAPQCKKSRMSRTNGPQRKQWVPMMSRRRERQTFLLREEGLQVDLTCVTSQEQGTVYELEVEATCPLENIRPRDIEDVLIHVLR